MENTQARPGALTEHGLSLYIETERHKLLFDTGQTDLFAQNARTLGVDLSNVDIAVLSHGHYDHGGGLGRFMEINKNAPIIYISRYAFEPYYFGAECYNQTYSAGLNASRGSGLTPDDFRHEQYLLIRDGPRRVLVSGCSHKGVLNIMEWFHPDVF